MVLDDTSRRTIVRSAHDKDAQQTPGIGLMQYLSKRPTGQASAPKGGSDSVTDMAVSWYRGIVISPEGDTAGHRCLVGDPPERSGFRTQSFQPSGESHWVTRIIPT
jgi:hypothetical protein